MDRYKHSISRKLSLSIMLIGVPIFLLSLRIFYNHTHDLIQQEAIERSNTILNTSVQRVVNYLSIVETAARSNAWLLEENFNPDSLQAISRRIVERNQTVNSCTVCTEPNVFPEHGKFFSSYTVNEGDTVITVVDTDFDYYDRTWYRSTVLYGKACWMEPFSDFSNGEINYQDAIGSYCIPLRPDGTNVEGVISADFSFKKLNDIVLGTEHPYPSSYYILIGEDGRYLIHPESNRLFKKTIYSISDSIDHADIFELGHAMTAGMKGITHVLLDNEPWHVCYAPIPGTKWSLALISPEDEVLAGYNHLARIMMLIILVGLLMMWWLTNVVVSANIRPIKFLLEATKQIVNGNYDTEIPQTNRKDPVSQMQNTFREMQESIVQYNRMIESTTEKLKAENEELNRVLPLAMESDHRKTLFIRSVKSQISTPINIIHGLMSVIKHAVVANKNNSQMPMNENEVQSIIKTMKHQAGILYRNTLMLFDSSDTGYADIARYDKYDVISCNEVARESIDFTVHNFFIPDVKFETELPDSFTVRTNHLYLMRSIRELLYNSAKFSDGNHITLRVAQTETTIHFIVEDVGPGLPKDLKGIIYTPFMKVDNLSEGFGLGLPLTRSHALGLGGNLIHDENYTKGCRFIFEIPK